MMTARLPRATYLTLAFLVGFSVHGCRQPAQTLVSSYAERDFVKSHRIERADLQKIRTAVLNFKGLAIGSKLRFARYGFEPFTERKPDRSVAYVDMRAPDGHNGQLLYLRREGTKWKIEIADTAFDGIVLGRGVGPEVAKRIVVFLQRASESEPKYFDRKESDRLRKHLKRKVRMDFRVMRIKLVSNLAKHWRAPQAVVRESKYVIQTVSFKEPHFQFIYLQELNGKLILIAVDEHHLVSNLYRPTTLLMSKTAQRIISSCGRATQRL